jgi:hypothetical protein
MKINSKKLSLRMAMSVFACAFMCSLPLQAVTPMIEEDEPESIPWTDKSKGPRTRSIVSEPTACLYVGYIYVIGLPLNRMTTVSVLNESGQTLFSTTTIASTSINIDVSTLTAGSYALRLEDTQGRYYYGEFEIE